MCSGRVVLPVADNIVSGAVIYKISTCSSYTLQGVSFVTKKSTMSYTVYQIGIGKIKCIWRICTLRILAIHGAKSYPRYILLDYFTTQPSFKKLNVAFSATPGCFSDIGLLTDCRPERPEIADFCYFCIITIRYP